MDKRAEQNQKIPIEFIDLKKENKKWTAMEKQT